MKNIFKILAVVLPILMLASSCKKDTSISVSVDPDTKSAVIRTGKPLNFKYAVVSGTGTADVKMSASENIALTTIPAADGLSGTLILVLKEEHEDSYVEIVASNGVNTETYRITLEMEAVLADGAQTVSVTPSAQDFSLGIKTNVEYDVEIPADAKEWLSYTPATKALVHEDIVLHATSNEDVARKAIVTIKSRTSSLSVQFTIVQEGIMKNLITTYGSREVVAPNLLGAGAEGLIFWGDGLTLKWQQDAKHIYTDNKTVHVAELHTTSSNAEYSTLMGVKKISFTDFK